MDLTAQLSALLGNKQPQATADSATTPPVSLTQEKSQMNASVNPAATPAAPQATPAAIPATPVASTPATVTVPATPAAVSDATPAIPVSTAPAPMTAPAAISETPKETKKEEITAPQSPVAPTLTPATQTAAPAASVSTPAPVSQVTPVAASVPAPSEKAEVQPTIRPGAVEDFLKSFQKQDIKPAVATTAASPLPATPVATAPVVPSDKPVFSPTVPKVEPPKEVKPEVKEAPKAAEVPPKTPAPVPAPATLSANVAMAPKAQLPVIETKQPEVKPTTEALEAFYGFPIIGVDLKEEHTGEKVLENMYMYLQKKGKIQKVGVIINGKGGSISFPVRLLHLLRSFATTVVVMIPEGVGANLSLVALGADEIHMGPLSYFSVVDPQVATHILSQKFSNAQKVAEMTRIFTENYPSHHYPIVSAEAQKMGLPIVEIADEQYMEMWKLVKQS